MGVEMGVRVVTQADWRKGHIWNNFPKGTKPGHVGWGRGTHNLIPLRGSGRGDRGKSPPGLGSGCRMDEARPGTLKVTPVPVPGWRTDKAAHYSLASLGAGPHVPVLGHKQR